MKKSLSEIEFETLHDVWIDVQYKGPLLTPDGHENKYAVVRRSKITGFTNWFDGRLANDPHYYRKPTEKEVKILAKIEYQRLLSEHLVSTPEPITPEIQPASNEDKALKGQLFQEAGRTLKTAKDNNFFIREGASWHIGFEGKDDRIKHLDGVQYIAHILQKRNGESISCKNLYQAVSRKTTNNKLSEDMAINEGLHIGQRVTQAKIDLKAKAEYIKKYKQLESELSRIDDLPDNERSPEVNMQEAETIAEMEAIKPFLMEGTFSDDDQKKVQSNIRKRLDAAYIVIGNGTLKELKKHLQKHIKPDTAYGFLYTGGLIWNITFEK